MTHSDDDVQRAHVGFPIRVNGQHSDPDGLAGQVVQFVRLDEGGEALGFKVQLCLVGEHLNTTCMTFDLQAPAAGLSLMDLQTCNI